MSATAQQREVAEKALAELEQERQGAWYHVASTYAASDSSRDAALYYLGKTVPAALDSLRRQLDLVDGESRWSQWVATATELHKGIAEVAGSTAEWGMASVLLGASREAAEQLGAAAKSGASWGAGTFTLLALAYVAWKVLK